MIKITKTSAIILVVLACLGAVYGIRFSTAYYGSGISGLTSGKIKGKDNAPIKVKEFIDFQCPACAYGAAYLKEMIDKYPSLIQFELKHYPLAMHAHGFTTSRYAECAAEQGKFWPFQDMLLARQSNWKRLADADPAFRQIAEEVHLDLHALQACLQDEAIDRAIEKDKEEGRRLGIRSTPTYFVNGKMLVGKKALEEELLLLLKEHGY